MTKIYRRNNLISGVTTKMKEKNRKRNKILNFRLSEEEKALIEKRIELSGMAKAEFLIKSCLNQQIVTYGNIKTFNLIKQQLAVIDEHLMAIKKSDELELEVLESLRTILEIQEGLDKGDENHE